ncbi:hypothetical protein H9Q74_013101 [Fusarium xylarioides]|nr:hypothetical protein H9Q71_013179 [Fusarium xylarioides]KAG5812497.1 hypothetical protein H9Q74_013101 [Fusarium xylarioides]
MEPIKLYKDFNSPSTRSDSHWTRPASEAQKNNPVEQSTVAQDMKEMEGVEEPAAKRRALGSGKLNARSFEYRDLQERRRKKTEIPSNSSSKGQSTCISGLGQDRAVAPHCGGSYHRFQVRIQNLSPLEDDVELKEDHVLAPGQNNNPSVTGKTSATWISPEEANATVFYLGPLNKIP